MKRMILLLGGWLCSLVLITWSARAEAPRQFTFTLESRWAEASTNKLGLYQAQELLGTNCCSPTAHYFRQKQLDVTWDCTWGTGDASSMFGVANYTEIHRVEKGYEFCIQRTGSYTITGPNPESSFSGTNSCDGWSITPGVSVYVCNGSYEFKTNTTSIDSGHGFADWDFAGSYNRNCSLGGGSYEYYWYWNDYEALTTCDGMTIKCQGGL
jgi:hypothetical protein